MVWLTFQSIGVLVLGYVVFASTRYFVRERQFAAFAKQNGCEKPISIGSNFIDGFRRLRRLIRLLKSGEDLLDDLVAEDLRESATVSWTSFDGTKGLETAAPTNLQAMLATQFEDFSVGYRRYNTFKPLVGHSIFSSDGPFWAHSRALFRSQFARENINDLEATEKATGDLMTAIGPPEADGWTSSTEMLHLLYNFTLDTATEFLFGESIESQKVAIAARLSSAKDERSNAIAAAQIAEAREFTDSFGIANEYILARIRMQSLYFLSDGFQFRRAIQNIRKVTERYVQLALNMAARSEKPDEKRQSLLYNLATQTQDRVELRDQTLSILLAGRDTTASLLSWTLTRLALHPDILDKLRGVVLQEFAIGEEISFTKLKGCRYLQHVLNEVLRLHPTVPMNQRIATKDTTLPTGGGPDQRSPVAVRKGQIVLFSVYNMQRREELWGAEAAEFRPERWEERRHSAWAFLPFLGGPRICLGQQFALTEAAYLIVRLMHEFDAIEPADISDMRQMKKGLGVTMWPKDGCKIRLHKS